LSALATKVDLKGRIATFTLGYSHSIEFYLPDGIDLKVEKQTHMVLTGSDRQLLGQVAANMRALRPPDPYKNKGVRYTGEALRKKVGKTAQEESKPWHRGIQRISSGCAFTSASAAVSMEPPSVRAWRCSAA